MALCSINGNIYEKKVYLVVKKCTIDSKPFNTQKQNELGGSTLKNDIICNYTNIKDVGIEIKKSKSPDWVQCSIKYNKEIKKWQASTKGKNPKECQLIFNNLLQNIDLYNEDIPPFMKRYITHEEWKKIKKETNKWNDKYYDIPSDTIRKLYLSKGCKYIQISQYGLYHLGEDVCNFGVPLFEIKQRFRIRTKVHSKKNKNGFCTLSVTCACQPINIKKLNKSNYSLDNKSRLPYKLKCV